MTEIAIEKTLSLLMNNMDAYRNLLPNLGYEIGAGTIGAGAIAITALL